MLIASNPKTCQLGPMLVCQAVGGESGFFGLIDFSSSVSELGFSKDSQGYSFEPFFGECELSSMARIERVWSRPVLRPSCIFPLILILSSKRVLSRGLI